MIIICYISGQDDFYKEIIHEWIRMDVRDEVGKLLCERVWKTENLKDYLQLENFNGKYIMCNEM